MLGREPGDSDQVPHNPGTAEVVIDPTLRMKRVVGVEVIEIVADRASASEPTPPSREGRSEAEHPCRSRGSRSAARRYQKDHVRQSDILVQVEDRQVRAWAPAWITGRPQHDDLFDDLGFFHDRRTDIGDTADGDHIQRIVPGLSSQAR